MLNQQTIEKLLALRLRGMADAFTLQQEDPNTAQLARRAVRVAGGPAVELAAESGAAEALARRPATKSGLCRRH